MAIAMGVLNTVEAIHKAQIAVVQAVKVKLKGHTPLVVSTDTVKGTDK